MALNSVHLINNKSASNGFKAILASIENLQIGEASLQTHRHFINRANATKHFLNDPENVNNFY